MKANKSPSEGISVALPGSFIQLAAEFGMVPAELASRVLDSFVRERPKKITVSKRKGVA